MATDIAVSLPDVDLPPGCTITVSTGDASAIITQLNVYTYSPERTPAEDLPPVPVLLAYSPENLPA